VPGFGADPWRPFRLGALANEPYRQFRAAQASPGPHSSRCDPREAATLHKRSQGSARQFICGFLWRLRPRRCGQRGFAGGRIARRFGRVFECEAKLCKGVARSWRVWLAEDRCSRASKRNIGKTRKMPKIILTKPKIEAPLGHGKGRATSGKGRWGQPPVNSA